VRWTFLSGLSYSNPAHAWCDKGVNSVFSDSVSNERRTCLSWRSQKHVLQTLETCLSRLRSAAIMTPSNQTWSLALMTSAPSWSDGVQPPNEASLWYERSSVLLAFSFRRLADMPIETKVSRSYYTEHSNQIWSLAHIWIVDAVLSMTTAVFQEFPAGSHVSMPLKSAMSHRILVSCNENYLIICFSATKDLCNC